MNISHRISEMAQKFPNKKSVVFSKARGGTYDYPFYTFAEFESRSNQLAHLFTEKGIRPGMRTLLFVKPCLDFSVITFALFKIGAVPVLIDPGMGLKNLLNSVKQVKPEALVSIGAVHWLRRLKKDFFQSVKLNFSLNQVGGRTHYLYKNLTQYPKTFTPVEVSLSDPSAILFTSGGTGIPKGVLYTHGILHAQTESLQKLFNLDETQVDLPGFPLFALFTLAMGMTSVIPDMDPTKPANCDPKKIVKNIIDNSVTFAAGSPAIWERVGKYCVQKNIQLASLKYVVMFGAPVRAEIHKLFQRVLPFGDTYTPYGATESLPVSCISGSEMLNSKQLLSLKGFGTCIGKPVHGTSLKILKTTDIPESQLHELKPGARGEIAVSGPQVTASYFDMDEETKKAKIIQDGVLWHRMGDVGWIDDEGALWFLGRKTHRVDASSGETYYSIQMEAVFNQHPEIKRTALIKLERNGKFFPGLVIERHDHGVVMTDKFLKDLKNLSQSESFTSVIQDFFLHPQFPVDVRHNIKIDRVKLSKLFHDPKVQTL